MGNAYMLKKVYIGITSLFTFFSLQAQGIFQTEHSATQQHWVDSLMRNMSVEEQIGQLFMVATYSNQTENHFKNVEKLIKSYHIGGLIFLQGGPVTQAKLTNRYQKAADIPLLIGMDAEWGLAMRLDSTVAYPKQLTLGAITDNRYIYNMGAEIARQLQVMGVHVNFAPVVDVNSNPNNPVIGYRSFGENIYQVAEKGKAYMNGMQDNHIIANAKHFPGHGDTDTDSHYTLPVINHSRDRINNVELYPFKELIQDSLLSMMVAHLHIPAFDSTANIATTLSHGVVTNLLKQDLNFKGLVFTDALNMQGVTKYNDPGEVDLKAFMAGNDVLLFPQNVPAAVSAFKKAIRQGVISLSDLEERVRKILAAKYWAGLYDLSPINTDHLIKKLNSPEAYLVRQKLYEQAITVVKNETSLIPFRMLDTSSMASLTIGSENYSGFQKSLDKYSTMSHYYLNKNTSDPNQFTSLFNDLKNYDHVLVGIHDVGNYPGNFYQLNPDNLSMLKDLAQQTNVVPVLFGNPYALKYFKDFDHLICAYEDNDMTHSIASQVLFGALSAKGKLPVSPDGELKEGTGVQTQFIGRLGYSIPEDVGLNSDYLNRIDKIAEKAIEDKATPGCQVLVAKNGKIIFEKSYGYQTYDKKIPVNNETIYDIASITKVAGTLQTIMFLEENKLIDLEEKVSHYLPEVKESNKKNLVLNDILTHQAGLLSYIPYWQNTVDEFGYLPTYYQLEPDEMFSYEVTDGLYVVNTMMDSLWEWTLASDLRNLPRNKKKYDYKYSDLGFYMLHRISEKILNQKMDVFLDQNFYKPLGLTTLGYMPLCRFSKERIAPTEDDYYFRKKLIHGTVHDPGAALCGGISGHAGLFSNAHDLAVLMQMNLQGGFYGGKQYLLPQTIQKFTSKQFEENRRGLGWDKPSFYEDYDVTSRFASAKTFGHTGFTGTSVWADPEFDLIYVFLSNRVHPDASNTKLITSNVRTRIHNVIYEAMWDYEKYHE